MYYSLAKKYVRTIWHVFVIITKQSTRSTTTQYAYKIFNTFLIIFEQRVKMSISLGCTIHTHTLFVYFCAPSSGAKIMGSIFSKIRIHELIKTIYTLSGSCLQCKHIQIKPLCHCTDADGWMWTLTQGNMTVLMDGCIIDQGLSAVWINVLFHLFPLRESLKMTKLNVRWTTNTTNICFLVSARGT